MNAMLYSWYWSSTFSVYPVIIGVRKREKLKSLPEYALLPIVSSGGTYDIVLMRLGKELDLRDTVVFSFY
jgi:hypothetical protein